MLLSPKRQLRLFLLCASLSALVAHAQGTANSEAEPLSTSVGAWDASGQLRTQWAQPRVADAGPLAMANAVQAGTAVVATPGATAEAELRARGHGFTSVATVQHQSLQGASAQNAQVQNQSWMNEVYASHDAGAWQFSAGKKIVSWDVGYAFRPNDLVQQEERRTLVSTTSIGRPVLTAERFNADSAWSLVAVNPVNTIDALGAQEAALAARAYLRDGAVDWHAFARAGQHTGASVGAAVAWVASDAVELHASARYARQVDSKAMATGSQINGVLSTNPWQASRLQDVAQALVGGTWTHVSQFSVLAEAWWDGSALSDDQWDAWGARNAQLQRFATMGAPASAVAGNLAWQAEAFGASSSLRRSNVFVRASWVQGAWTPAVDVLYTPADQGQAVSASVVWQGDRMQVQAGVRSYGGPGTAVMVQLPTQQTAYVHANWSF
ncbi:hypothetical protein [Rhodoferax aquaticus]|uniref:Porin n=1 Tax=Rhodoferax aquaticus TaxID=2527691 RepID=A0A515EQT9_9BURK|nr:hypothetical protein [Rhodoferax aquaticus]QDL55021.1 hypothetical protein EXZ61_13070 [Rhodoferax aquaticus]